MTQNTHEDEPKGDKDAPLKRVFGPLEPEATKMQLSNASPEAALASLFHAIMYERGVSIITIGPMLERFLDRYNIPGTKISPDRKNNLMKEIRAPTMTWPKFLKNLLLMDLTKIEITIVAHGRNGVTTKHHHTVHLDGANLLKDL